MPEDELRELARLIAQAHVHDLPFVNLVKDPRTEGLSESELAKLFALACGGVVTLR